MRIFDDVVVPDIGSDTAFDVPLVAQTFSDTHPGLSEGSVHPIPSVALMLRGAQGNAIGGRGFIIFDVTPGIATIKIDALVIPPLGKDKLLLGPDGGTIRSLHVVSDWDNETSP